MPGLEPLWNHVIVSDVATGTDLHVSPAGDDIRISVDLDAQPEVLEVRVTRTVQEASPRRESLFEADLRDPCVLVFSDSVIRWSGYMEHGEGYRKIRVELSRRAVA